MLLVVCSAYSQFKSADRVIQEKGMTYETHGEPGTVIRQRPEVRIRDAARTQYFRALSELARLRFRWSESANCPRKNSEGKNQRHGGIFHELKGDIMFVEDTHRHLARQQGTAHLGR